MLRLAAPLRRTASPHMERSSILRWVLIGVAVFLLIQFGLPLITGEGKKKDKTSH